MLKDAKVMNVFIRSKFIILKPDSSFVWKIINTVLHL